MGQILDVTHTSQERSRGETTFADKAMTGTPLSSSQARVKKFISERFLRQGKEWIDCTDGQRVTKNDIKAILYKAGLNVYQDAGARATVSNLGDSWDVALWNGTTEFRPNQPLLMEINDKFAMNSWRHSGIVEAEGDITPFLTNLSLALDAANYPWKLDFMLDFFAWRYQNPELEHKAPHGLYLYGPQGQGKGNLRDALTKVFGSSSIKYGQTSKTLTGEGSVVNLKAVFFIVDEFKIAKGSDVSDQIKAKSTERTGQDRVQYEVFREHETPAQLIMLSNHPPSFLDEDDRRFFVTSFDTGMTAGTDPHKAHFKSYDLWLKSDAGIAALAYFLRHRDVSKYDRFSPPPMTDEKKKATSIVKDPRQESLKEELEQDYGDFVVFQENWLQQRLIDTGVTSINTHHHVLAACGLTREKEFVNRLNHGKGIREFGWVRDGWEVIKKQGKPTVVRNKLTNQQKDLRQAFHGSGTNRVGSPPVL